MQYIINNPQDLNDFMVNVVNARKLQIGDVCIVNGEHLPYVGEIEYKDIVKYGYCTYILKEYNTLWFRHNQRKSNISSLSTNYKLGLLALNTDKMGKPRERVDKELFIVPETPKDNYLKLIIKRILFKEQIDLRDYKNKFDNVNHMNNMKRLITSDSNLTYEKFVEWLTILGYTHTISVFDKYGNNFE